MLNDTTTITIIIVVAVAVVVVVVVVIIEAIVLYLSGFWAARSKVLCLAS